MPEPMLDKATRALVVDNVRNAGKLLKRLDTDVLFPGWHYYEGQSTDDVMRCNSIRRAAFAILADGVGPMDGTRVTTQELAALVRYIADMMEE